MSGVRSLFGVNFLRDCLEERGLRPVFALLQVQEACGGSLGDSFAGVLEVELHFCPDMTFYGHNSGFCSVWLSNPNVS